MSCSDFDASGVGIPNGNFFGFPWAPHEADILLVTIPWDATTSYRRGTSLGPQAMIDASPQLDFHSFDTPGNGIIPIGTDRSLEDGVRNLNHQAGSVSQRVIKALEEGADVQDPWLQQDIHKVNLLSEELSAMVYQHCKALTGTGKRLILAGGEHSIPLGFLKALAESESSFGILQIDAHADLRQAYEGFDQSHASIMFNALSIPQIIRITQVAIRDISEPEIDLIESSGRLSLYSDFDLKNAQYAGVTWFEQCRDIVAGLPQKVYISFDIDGLQQAFCPNTGTPVPGGITPDEAMYLIRMVAESGRQIIGADLCEVAPGNDEWDASVGARILYRLACLMHHSHHPTVA